jgi:hypothetical protein
VNEQSPRPIKSEQLQATDEIVEVAGAVICAEELYKAPIK